MVKTMLNKNPKHYINVNYQKRKETGSESNIGEKERKKHMGQVHDTSFYGNL